jgi:hypothetical protein
MAIKVGGTTVINDSRSLTNITSIDATSSEAIGNQMGVASYDTPTSETGYFMLPKGTSAQRAASVQGTLRFNTTFNTFEVYKGSSWRKL